MWTRRRFLGSTGIGLLGASAACHLPAGVKAAKPLETLDVRLQERVRQQDHKQLLLGYPVNMNRPPIEFFEWKEKLLAAGIDGFAYNNVDNPFGKPPIPFNTHDFERDAILIFGQRIRFPAKDTWGFISHSGTDSNMHGMYMGRTILQSRTGKNPLAYFTREAHYSVQILRDLLGLDTVLVDTLRDGAMDPDDLAAKLAEHPQIPALVVATVGTTFKGAIDDVACIRQKLVGHPSYLHLDAALFGGYLPFTKYAQQVAHCSDEFQDVGNYDSIAVSCHKFFGFPSPAGVFVTTRKLYREFNIQFSRIHNPEYIHQVPGTITCSRDAVKPAEFYFLMTPEAQAWQRRDAAAMLENATYLMHKLQEGFPQFAAQRATAMSNTVYFKKPSDWIVRKYSLATMQLKDAAGQAVEHAHAIVMPHVSRGVVDEFLGDLRQHRPS